MLLPFTVRRKGLFVNSNTDLSTESMCRDAFRDKPRSTLRAIQCNADWHGVKFT